MTASRLPTGHVGAACSSAVPGGQYAEHPRSWPPSRKADHGPGLQRPCKPPGGRPGPERACALRPGPVGSDATIRPPAGSRAAPAGGDLAKPWTHKPLTASASPCQSQGWGPRWVPRGGGGRAGQSSEAGHPPTTGHQLLSQPGPAMHWRGDGRKEVQPARAPGQGAPPSRSDSAFRVDRTPFPNSPPRGSGCPEPCDPGSPPSTRTTELKPIDALPSHPSEQLLFNRQKNRT